MAYNITSKFSYQISEKEWFQLKESFNSVFNKNLDINYFKKKYFETYLGYSCHGILYFKNRIVGFFSIIPREYFLQKKKEIIGLACDAYILKEHRKDELFLKKMSDLAISKIGKENVKKFISLPNPGAYKYWKYISKWNDIGELNYYFFPINYSKLILNKSVLYFFSYSFSLALSFIFKFLYLKSEKITNKIYHINLDGSYEKQRFNLPSYIRVVLNDSSWGYYRIFKENNLNVAYIIYLKKASKRNISEIINQIIFDNYGKIDLIIFIGTVSDKPFHFLKIPKSKQPRKLIFTGLDMDNKENKNYFNLDNWQVNLVNFDNR